MQTDSNPLKHCSKCKLLKPSLNNPRIRQCRECRNDSKRESYKNRNSPLRLSKRLALFYRLMSKVEIHPEVNWNGTPCWIWCGTRTPIGYGQFSVGGIKRGAHVITYEWFVGEIPSGLTIDHLCRVRQCCNPIHLEVTTYQVNILRGNNMAAQYARRTHCPNNHEYTPENTAGRSGKTERICRTCRNAKAREYAQKKRLKLRLLSAQRELNNDANKSTYHGKIL